ncbi:hypothetical protein DRW07_02055 [Alteromonas sediminis]|uniref:Uncharacterized protein n=2 Tax=Alteromonas sediminis TaxID=2259342 RepID=A0A3N5ZAQ8_9ALTE|nr:hypothetical protein [Alteromonas sediminis]RPJ68214.1 hypothetical protein DRW07_02055 [Alteromonas sediminis]
MSTWKWLIGVVAGLLIGYTLGINSFGTQLNPTQEPIHSEADLVEFQSIPSIESNEQQTQEPSPKSTQFESRENANTGQCESEAYQESLDRYERLSKTYSGSLNQISELMHLLREAGVALPDNLTQDEIDAALPHPFTDTITYAGLITRQKYKEHLDAERDYSWALNKETQISDFLNFHDDANGFFLDKVTCKQSSCEVRLFETISDTSSQAHSDLYSQDFLRNEGATGYGSSSAFYGEVDGVDVVGYRYIFISFERNG